MQPKVAEILTRVGCATECIIDRVRVSKVEESLMNIEIANKLVKLRKQNGLSQEELADKLGLSRQAVSKWERAEASPDTDNLICLAKLYNISLDELLSTEDDVDTIVKEQVKKDNKEEVKEDKTAIHIDDEGLHAIDEDGSEVTITKKGIHITDKDGNRYIHDDSKKRKQRHIYYAISSICMALALLTYILLGILLNMWATMWIVFFVPDIIASTYKCIVNREAHSFNMVFTTTLAFFLVCLVLLPEKNLWHPMWVVFLAIPVYYLVVGRIETVLRDNKKEVIVDVDDDLEGEEEAK